MKIIDNAIRDFTFFELGIGATFKCSGVYFIKIQEVEYNTHFRNAVRLDSGDLYCFDVDDKVIPFNCELIVL